MAGDDTQVQTAAQGASGGPTDADRTPPRVRLLEAMVELVSRDGYMQAGIGELARIAHVSRATFYELFHDKEECFLFAYAQRAAQLQRHVGEAIDRGEPRLAAQAAVRELAESAAREPHVFDFLFGEALLVSLPARTEHDALFSRLERAIEVAWERGSGAGVILDISSRLLLEASARLLAMRIGRGGMVCADLVPDLLGWIDSYAVSNRSPRWRLLAPVDAMRRGVAGDADRLALRASLPRGRHGLSPEVVRTLHKERIAYGTASAIRAKGYANVTVRDIVASAGVSRDVFYAEFHDKQGAFDEAVKLVFEQLLATMGGAYFGCTGEWPDRVWAAGEAFARYVEDNPVLAHFLFVTAHAPPPHVDRIDDFVMAFKLFLDGGYGYGPRGASASPLASEALVCAVLSAVTYQVRHDRARDVRGLIPIVVYMVIAPFTGPEAAERFVDGQTRTTLAGGGTVRYPVSTLPGQVA